MERFASFIPMDRRQALAKEETLPDRAKGTVLFADISGYTKLTQAVMQTADPKQGAEWLTNQINMVFTALIAEVHRYRGSVIGFGGDALTCWFNDDQGERAMTCAVAMQQVMTAFASLEVLPNQSISLTIKVSIVTGSVRRLQVGNPRIKLFDVIAGKTINRMAQAEDLAQKEEIIIGQEIADHLKGNVEIVEQRGDKFFVASNLNRPIAPQPWPALIQPLSDHHVRSRILDPVYEQLKWGRGQSLGQFRRPVALFLKFEGVDYDKDENAEEKLDGYLRFIQEIIDRYKGYVIKLTIGDKGSYLLATFGAPLSHDSAASNAVTAALDLQSLSRQFPFIHTVQIGLSQGEMLVGTFGSKQRRAYDVLGDEANMAARLMSKAIPGQVLISARVALAATSHFSFTGPVPTSLKGSNVPLPVYQIDKRKRPDQGVAPSPTMAIVGRDRELTQLETLQSKVREGRGQIVRVAGVAGIGKSRLINECSTRSLSQDWQVVIGACQSTNQHIPYFSWQQILREVLGLPVGDTDEVQLANSLELKIKGLNQNWLERLPLLADALNLPVEDNETIQNFDVEQRREVLFNLIIDLLKHQAQAKPLLLIIEDGQWLDDISKNLLLAVSQSISEAPILLIISHRVSDLQSWDGLTQHSHHHLISLKELPLIDVEAFIAQWLQADPSRLLVSMLQARTNGNPFFLEELLKVWQDNGRLRLTEDGSWDFTEKVINSLGQVRCLQRVDGTWDLIKGATLTDIDLDLPNEVSELIQSRIDQLDEAHKMTLQVAATIGDTFEFELLSQAHPDLPRYKSLQEQFNVFEEQNLILQEAAYPHLTYRFKHHLIQEAINENLLEYQQKLLHSKIAEGLETLYPAAIERLAYHYGQTDHHKKALIYLDQAAQKAQRESANVAALHYFDQAITIERKVGQSHWERRKGQVEVLHILGAREREKDSLEVLASHPEAPFVEAAYLWGKYYEAISDYPQAIIEVGSALQAYQNQSDQVGEVRCLTYLGLITRRQGNYEVAKGWYKQALELLQNEAPNTEEIEIAKIQIHNELGIVYRQQGNYADAKNNCRQSLTLSQKIDHQPGEANALNNLGVIAFYQRNFAEALSYHHRTLAIWQTIGNRSGEGNSLTNLGKVTRDAGDYDQAQRYLNEALKVQQAIANRWEEVNIWIDLGGLYYELGEMVTAQTCLDQGLRLSRVIGDEVGQAYVLCNLGLVLHARDEQARAEDILREALRLAEIYSETYLASTCHSYLSLVSLETDRLDLATEQAQQSLALRQDLEASHPRITDDLATLAAVYMAKEHYDEALDFIHKILPILNSSDGEGPEFPQRSYFISYQIFIATDQPDQAEVALQAAYNLVMSRADKLTNSAQRQSFLQGLAINRRILKEYGNAKGNRR